MFQHPLQRSAVKRDDPFKNSFGSFVEPALLLLSLMPQQLRAKHGRQRQRHGRRHQNRYGKGYGEFAKEPAGDIAHEQQWDQHCDERNRQRHNRESDLLCSFEGRLQRTFAFLHVAHDVLDHHDRIVHYEPGGDCQRHQSQVVKAIAKQIHDAESTHKR